jgi:DNA-binding protein HU-beta
MVIAPTVALEVTMTKADLAEVVASRCGIPRSQASVVVDTLLAGVTDALQRGDKVELKGSGSFRAASGARAAAGTPAAAAAPAVRLSPRRGVCGQKSERPRVSQGPLPFSNR